MVWFGAQPMKPPPSSGIRTHRYPMANHFAAGCSATQPSATITHSAEAGEDGASSSEVCQSVRGWILTIILWGLVVGFAISLSTDDSTSQILPGVFTLPVYFVYGVASLTDPVATYVRLGTHTSPEEYVRTLLCNPPKMSMHIECYHEVATTDTTGATSTVHDVTHRAESPIPIRFWDDVSSIEFPRMGPSLMRLELELVAEAADDATLSAIDAQYSAFVTRNKSDEQQHHYVGVWVDDFPEHSCALLIMDGATAGCFGFCWYVLFTLLTLSAPYRVFFYACTSRVKVQIKKVVRV